jgi:DNA-binding HxlR family transcriptional regulator
MKTTSVINEEVTVSSPAASTSMAPLETRVGCIAGAMEIIGNKWTALILRDLAAGSSRFCNLEKSVGKINPRTLSQRLDTLAAQGIVSKSVCPEAAPHCNYQLTDKGRDLLPVLKQMAAWGAKYAA